MTETIGWYLWDNDTMNAVGYYATETEALRRREQLIEANPGWGDDLAVFEDPTVTTTPGTPT